MNKKYGQGLLIILSTFLYFYEKYKKEKRKMENFKVYVHINKNNNKAYVGMTK